MFHFLLFLHGALCLALIGLVLLQQGKGADVGATFGGGSDTLFGAAGAGNLVGRVTTGIAVLFMVTSIFLVRTYQHVGFVSSGPIDPLSGSVMQDVVQPSNLSTEETSAEGKVGDAGSSTPDAGAQAELPPAPVVPPAAANPVQPQTENTSKEKSAEESQ